MQPHLERSVAEMQKRRGSCSVASIQTHRGDKRRSVRFERKRSTLPLGRFSGPVRFYLADAHVPFLSLGMARMHSIVSLGIVKHEELA